MTTPLFFGASARPLFGVYHPPAGARRLGSAVVICPPVGHEYMRTHRALRTLALQLARAGHGVLRFDWSGTGDSAGEPEHARVRDWFEDFAAALDEARELVAAPSVHVVGLRLGATLALLAAGEQPIDTLVLWDPVMSGGEFLRDQATAARESVEGPAANAVLSLIGFPMTRPLWDDITGLEVARAGPGRARRVVLVTSGAGLTPEALRGLLGPDGPPVTHRHVPREGDWDEMDRLGAALLPHDVLQAIGEELT